MLPHSAQAFGPWETDLLPPQKCNMFVSRRGLETTGAGTFKKNSCTTELLVTGRTHPSSLLVVDLLSYSWWMCSIHLYLFVCLLFCHRQIAPQNFYVARRSSSSWLVGGICCCAHDVWQRMRFPLLLAFRCDISFFHWPGMQLMLIHIYIYTHNDTELELAVFVLVGIIGDNYQKVSGDG